MTKNLESKKTSTKTTTNSKSLGNSSKSPNKPKSADTWLDEEVEKLGKSKTNKPAETHSKPAQQTNVKSSNNQPQSTKTPVHIPSHTTSIPSNQVKAPASLPIDSVKILSPKSIPDEPDYVEKKQERGYDDYENNYDDDFEDYQDDFEDFEEASLPSVPSLPPAKSMVNVIPTISGSAEQTLPKPLNNVAQVFKKSESYLPERTIIDLEVSKMQSQKSRALRENASLRMNRAKVKSSVAEVA